ncbi:unnamed protein product, partial [Mesorhabditis belari]|uniref:Uncharacterized protein n=1 Tax=Mesorhabditis belari TaxID=2138241 RepID=A0AAF3FFC6_9BILA
MLLELIKAEKMLCTWLKVCSIDRQEFYLRGKNSRFFHFYLPTFSQELQKSELMSQRMLSVRSRSDKDWKKVFEMIPQLGEEKLVIELKDGGTLVRIEGEMNDRRFLLHSPADSKGFRARIYLEKNSYEDYLLSDVIDREGNRCLSSSPPVAEIFPKKIREMWLGK